VHLGSVRTEARGRLQAPPFDHAGPRHDARRWHVLCDYGTRSDNGAPADGHSGRDRGGGADPHFVLNHDRGVSGEVVALIEFDRMAGSA